LESFCHSHRVHWFAGFVGRNADDSFDTQMVFLDRSDDVFRSPDIRLHGFVGKILTGRHLLERGSIEYNIHAVQGLRYRVRIPNVTDAKFQFFLEVAVNNFVGGRHPMLVFHAHQVLFRFVARKYDDFGGVSVLAFQETSD
jgi:hypothetical protein